MAKAVEQAKAAEDARQQAAAKKAEDERLAEAKRAEAAKATVAAQPAEQAVAESQRQTAVISQLERLVERGDRYVDEGNILVARQYFLRAAQGGFAAAAFKLAETHDPHELARLNVQGLMPDPAEAKRWYTRASDLGASEAEARLGRLGD